MIEIGVILALIGTCIVVMIRDEPLVRGLALWAGGILAVTGLGLLFAMSFLDW